MFTVLSYQVASGGSVTDKDMTALTDSEFSQRNNHYIFTEPYDARAFCLLGATPTRLTISVPTVNAFGKFNVWPVNNSATVPSPPQKAWFLQSPVNIPLMEEMQHQVTVANSETDQSFMWLTSKDWNQNLPQGQITLSVRFTATITIVANAWSAIGSITLDQALRGGVYAVLNAKAQGTNMTAFRLIFPRQRMYHGRKLRPGDLATNAIGNLEEAYSQINPFLWGEWGRFHTFELPQMEITGGTAGSTAIVGYLWLSYLGQNPTHLDQWAGQGVNMPYTGA